MIRSNLSTRPFYNDAAVTFWLLVIALVVVAATVVNVERFVRYSRSDTDLASRAAVDEQRARDLLTESRKLRASVDVSQIDVTAADADVANGLIERRASSWTELFNRFEATLPAEVRITSLRQNIEKARGIVLTITVVAAGVEAIDDFMEKLRATSAFTQELVTEERVDPDTGQIQAVLQTVYRPSAGVARAANEAVTP